MSQALADVASVMAEMERVHNNGKPMRWVTFGGSYSGALSAWFRILYPHKVSQNHSSSVPVYGRCSLDVPVVSLAFDFKAALWYDRAPPQWKGSSGGGDNGEGTGTREDGDGKRKGEDGGGKGKGDEGRT